MMTNKTKREMREGKERRIGRGVDRRKEVKR